VKEYGVIDILSEITLAEWDEVINTNLRGTFLCSGMAANELYESELFKFDTPDSSRY